MRKGTGLALAAIGLATVSAQMTMEPFRNLHLKQNLKGAPSMLEQVEFMQNAVNYLQGFIQPKGVNKGTGDYAWQYLQKGPFGDFLGCQTCWYATDEVASLISNNAIKQSIESNLIEFCS